eukprot:scaffold21958_cov66-Phaeocystis_antarctica.AAC.1
MRDAAGDTHTLEVRAPVLTALLTFVYEGSCDIEESQLTEMLDAAARLMVEPLKAACAAMMAAQLSPDNALEVWRIAEAFSLPALEKAAVASALHGFEELPPQLASGAQVLALVQEEMLVAKDEEAVFVWITWWWEAAERPEAELMVVLKHVRFATMAEGFLRDTVRAWPALLSAGGQGLLHVSLAPVVGDAQPLRRLGFGPHRIYLVGGALQDGGAASTVRAYDPALDSWCEVASMVTARCRHGVVALGGKLYVMGGSDDERTAIDEAEVYDPKADGWQPLPSMPTARRYLAAVAVGGKVYAIGGDDNVGDACDVVEAYDPLSGAWTRVASLPVARSFHTATVIDGKIYVLGGYTDDDQVGCVATDRVDVYDPVADSWQQLAAMPTARSSLAAAVVDGKIYVSGGFTASGHTSDAFEAYDPVTNRWTTLAGLSQARAFHTSAAFNGKLCVFGGYSVDGRIDLVEIYSPASNSWARAADMPSAADDFVAVAL